MAMKEQLALMPEEKVLWEGQADMFYRSSNPLVKILMFFVKIFMFVVGIRVTGTLVLTTRRVFFTYDRFFLWFFRYASGRTMVPNHRISAVGYGYEASFLVFFKTKVVVISAAGTPEVVLALKKISEEELNRQFGILFQTVLVETDKGDAVRVQTK